MQRNRKVLVGLLLLSLFGASLLVRLPLLNRPLSRHHEWSTTSTLIHQQVWHETGGSKYRFCPRLNFNNPADKHVNNDGNLEDPFGNFYYVSFPPFATIFPYAVFQLFHIVPDVLPLQLFNLFFHFVSCFFIFRIILLLTRRNTETAFPIAALLGFCVYLFSPMTLWYQCNVYYVDMFLQPIFILGVYLFLKWETSPLQRGIYCLGLGVVIFFMTYTEWMGLFFAFSVFLYGLSRFREKGMKSLLATAVLSSFSALLLTLWQYSWISGFIPLAKLLLGRLLYRSGLAENTGSHLHVWSGHSWMRVAFHYVTGYLPVLLCLLAMAVIYFVLRSKREEREKLGWHRLEILTLSICLSPVLLHHLIFFNYTSVHEFAVLKTSVFISILTALLYDKLSLALQVRRLQLFLILMGGASILQYALINGRGTLPYKKLGEEIKREAKKEETVFIQGNHFWIFPQVVFYAHRNLALWDGESKARSLLQKNGAERGVVLILNSENNEIIGKTYIEREP